MKRKASDEGAGATAKKPRNWWSDAKKYIEENYPSIAKSYANTISNMRDIRGLVSQWAKEDGLFSGWIGIADDLDAIRSSPDDWHRTFLTTILSYVEKPTRKELDQLMKMDVKTWSNLFIFISYVLYHTTACLPLLVSSGHPIAKELFIKQIAEAIEIMKAKPIVKSRSSSFAELLDIRDNNKKEKQSVSFINCPDLLSRVNDEEIAKMLLYMVDVDHRIGIINVAGVYSNPTMIRVLIREGYDCVTVLPACIGLNMKTEAQTMVTKYLWTPEQMAIVLKTIPHPQMESFAATFIKRWCDKSVVLEEIVRLFATCALSVSYIQEIANVMTYDWIRATVIGSPSFAHDWNVETLLVKNSVVLYDLYISLGVDVDQPVKLENGTIHPLQRLMSLTAVDLYPLVSQRYSYDPFALLVDTVRAYSGIADAVAYLIKQHQFSRDQLLYALSVCKSPKNQDVVLTALDYKKTFDLPPLAIKKRD